MTDVSTNWAEVIFRVKWIVFVSRWCYKVGPLNVIAVHHQRTNHNMWLVASLPTKVFHKLLKIFHNPHKTLNWWLILLSDSDGEIQVTISFTSNCFQMNITSKIETKKENKSFFVFIFEKNERFHLLKAIHRCQISHFQGKAPLTLNHRLPLFLLVSFAI